MIEDFNSDEREISWRTHKNRPDKRVEKTKNAIYEALLGLVKHKPISAITITELASMANINRKTFYAYYTTIEDVIDEFIEELISNMVIALESISLDYSTMSPNTLILFFEMITQNNEEARQIFLSENGAIIILELQKGLSKVILSEMKNNSSVFSIDSKYFMFIANYISSGMVTCYHAWLENPSNIDVEELSKILSMLIANGLSSLEKK